MFCLAAGNCARNKINAFITFHFLGEMYPQGTKLEKVTKLTRKEKNQLHCQEEENESNLKLKLTLVE